MEQNSVMTETVKTLSKDQIDFIANEFGIDEGKLLSMAEDELDALYDKICDIEVEETISAEDGELSERGKTAVSIVTLFGIAIKETYGYEE